jgi:hypothetical protein
MATFSDRIRQGRTDVVNDSWNEHRRMLCAMGAFRALRRDIRAGRALLALQRSFFNPWVLGSSPRRPTCESLA